MKKSLSQSRLLEIAVLAVVYLLTAKFGLTLGAVSGFATLVWPATGIALAALLLLGFRVWPGIALGALAVNCWVGAPFLVACGIALGNTLEALVGAYLFRKIAGSRTDLGQVKDVMALVILAALLSTLVSATFGVTSLFVGGVVSGAAYGPTWRAWWIGDLLSDLVIAPLLLVWHNIPRLKTSLRRLFEGGTLTLLVLALSLLIFGPWTGPELRQYVFPYFVFPLLMWTTIRFGQHANTGLAFAVSAIAIYGAIHGNGPFQAATLDSRLFSLQLFVAALSVTGLFFGALGREKEEAIRLRSEFLAIASHELKTPLTSMKLQIGSAKRKLDEGQFDVNQAKALFSKVLDLSDRQVDRLVKLVNDLLDTSGIQAGRFSLEFEDLDLSSLVAEVLERFQPQIRASQCALKTRISPGLHWSCDRYRMEQVVINLLTNALKYGAGKTVEVSLQREGNSVRLSVKDCGMGIAKEHRTRIFEPYERVVRGQKIGGLGLGLYITKQIVEAHHGKVQVESELGQGSEFIVELQRFVRG